ncbi:MAG: hypothetical protein ACT4PZ_09025 [Panacagrimonas sp.]
MTVVVYVPDIPEFGAVVEAARQMEICRVQPPLCGYWRIESDTALSFDRKAMKLGPALWYSLLSGGFCGRILEYGRDQLVIGADA